MSGTELSLWYFASIVAVLFGLRDILGADGQWPVIRGALIVSVTVLALAVLTIRWWKDRSRAGH